RKVSKSVDSQQSTVDGQSADGQLMMRTGFPKRKRVRVSGSATAATVGRELKRMSNNGGAARAQELELLGQSLSRFTAAQYSRNGSLDDSALDESLDSGFQILRRLKLEHTWPMRRFAARRGAAPAAAGTKVWSR